MKDKHYALLALFEVALAIVFIIIGWPLLAGGWVLLAAADLITFEWLTNHDQYGWDRDEALLRSIFLDMIPGVYFLVYLVTLVF